MKIESPVQDVSRKLLSSSKTGGVADRRRSVTSDPNGNSTGKANRATPEMSRGILAHTAQTPAPIDVAGAVEKLNKLVQSQRTNVSFSVDKDANATVIKVFKTETGELIKQFPPEEILAMKAKISKSVGWLIDNKV